MYSRRLKLNKKKPKPSRTKQTPGSNWGPRLALIERERAIASGAILDDDKEDLYDIQHELVHNINKKSSSPGTGGGAIMAGGGGGSTGRMSHNHNNSNSSSHYGITRNHNDSSTGVDPVLRLGRSSSPNYFYYNYSRRTAPNAAASSQRKVSCPEPSSSVHSQQQQQREKMMMMNGGSNKSSSHSHLHQQQQHHRRASYVLGSSSGYCSGSVTTLSTCANNSDERISNNNSNNFSKPLTLIIPPHDGHGHPRHPMEFNGNNGHQSHYQKNGGGVGGGILLQRGALNPRHHLHDHKHQNDNGGEEEFGTEEQSLEDSFQSSSAYQSSCDEEHGVVVGHNERIGPTMVQVGGQEQSKRPFQNPMAHMNRNKKGGGGGNGGILQISTKKEVVQVYAVPKMSPQQLEDMGTGTEPETLEIGTEVDEVEGDDGSGNGDKVGSTITALHKGITMVYVPMKESGGEEGVHNGNDNNNNCDDDSSEDMPELGHQHLTDNDCCSASTSSSYRGDGAASKEPEDSLMSSNFILKRKQEDNHHSGGAGEGAAGAAPVMDSLLDSFDSILFKPKPGEALQKSQERCQQLQQNGSQQQVEIQHKGIRKRHEQPPPLPPSGGEQNNGQQQLKQKSLRFALENLETVLNPSSLVPPSPSSSSEDSATDNQNHNHRHNHRPHYHEVPPPLKKVLKKVTLSLPGEDAISSRNHELLLNYEELNTCSTEVLSCGHVRNDDYSTISSMTSSAQEISDLEEMINGCSGSGHNDGGDGGPDGPRNSNSSSGSGGESDVGSNGVGRVHPKNKTMPQQPQQPREPRSVLQQLRDLSRLIRGSSPTKPPASQSKKEKEAAIAPVENNNNSFYLHNSGSGGSNNSNDTGTNNNGGGDSEVAKRKTSDATDNSADSGKGSGSGTSASGSSGQEGSSASSAEASPNNTRDGLINGVVGAKGTPFTNQKILQQTNGGRKLKIATIRGRGGGTRSRHFCPTDDENHLYQGLPTHREEVGVGDDSCSQRSSVCSCQECCDYRSDCNECVLYSKPPNSQELCSNETSGRQHPPTTRTKSKQQSHPTQNLPPPPPPPSQQRAPKQSVSKLLVRRTSSRIRAAAARRTASLRRAAQAKLQLREMISQRKPVILDYCDCSNCDMQGCGDHRPEEEQEDDDEFDEVDYDEEIEDSGGSGRGACCSNKHCKRPSPPNYQQHHDTLLIPIPYQPSHKKSSSGKCKSRAPDPRKISSSSSSSTGKNPSRISQQQKQAGSQLLRQSDAASNGAALANNPLSVVPIGIGTSTSTGNLFTIDEANEDSVYGEAAAAAAGGGASGGVAVVIGKGRNPTGASGSLSSSSGSNKSGPRVDFQLHDVDLRVSSMNGNNNNNGNRRMSSHSQHSHPKCWLAPDATLGWSDLESLYSQNMKMDGSYSREKSGNIRGGGSSKKGHPLPAALRDECPTCWKELSKMKKNCPDPNRTVDRTKRMFIWLNRRHKEFHAPWWEAKKQASMRWLVTKSFAHAVPKDKIPDPFKESKKGKPTKYSLRDEIVKGLVSGRLYCMALDSLYRSQQNNYHLSQNLTHWEIIKILSRRGIYIAQPSDMKLTETTLRQKKPIRTAAHIALIEAMMGLYAKEILGRDRIAATLRSFGRAIDPDTNSPERLVITWINTAVTTLKSYILSNAPPQLPANKVNRWLNLPDVCEIRDLCDGVGVCALFALYCSNDLKIEEIYVPEPGDTLTIYDSITNHSLVQKLCDDLFPEPIYHLCVTDFLYIHGCMKQNILCFLVDLFVHLEINPILRVNRLTHVPIRVELETERREGSLIFDEY